MLLQIFLKISKSLELIIKFRLYEKSKSSIWVKKCRPARGSDVWEGQWVRRFHRKTVEDDIINCETLLFLKTSESLDLIIRFRLYEKKTNLQFVWKNVGLQGAARFEWVSESDDFIERPLKMTSFIVKHGCGQPLTATR